MSTTDLLLRLFPFDDASQAYPVEAELSDGSRFTAGQLQLDAEALRAHQLDAEAYGQALFNMLFPAGGNLRHAYDKAVSLAEAETSGRLRVRLWIEAGAVELHALAWERLYHPHQQHWISLTASTLRPFSRYTSLETREPPPIAETPLKMLVVIANPLNLPGGLAPANVELEVENLRRSLAELRRDNQLQVTLMPGRTGLSATLRERLLGEGYQLVEGVSNLFNIVQYLSHCHIFHFIGHGAFRRTTGGGDGGTAALYLEKADGTWQAVKDEEIVSMLTAVGTLPHLTFLVACESAKREAGATSPFVGLGPKLVQAGVPAVVAMQEQVPVELARALSSEFYTRLAEHGEVDRALNQARLQVFDKRSVDWAVPVLFMRIRSGRLFGAELEDDAPAPGEPPFKGLQFFDEHDADKFYGRELLTARLVGHLHTSRFLPVIVGASGSGKSSVVRAGVIPALKRGEPLADGSSPPAGSADWPIHVLTPTTQPLESLATALTRDAESITATATLTEDLRLDRRTLHFYARKLLARASAQRLLIVVDQFEELFTVCKNEAARRAFIDNLIYASAPDTDGPTVVILIFRADFYAHCAQYDNLRVAVSKHQEFVGPMNATELRRSIEEPAKQGGWDLEPGLVEALLKDVGVTADGQAEPGALPLLSHALLETWKNRRGRQMTLRGYAEAGGVRGAIAKTAEAVYQQLPSEQKAIARRIFLRLVELGEGQQDTRRRAELTELSPSPDQAPLTAAVLKKLVDARLVTTTATTAEVAHEALIREWPTFRAWINANREGLRVQRDLSLAAREWDNLLREPGALYRGVKLIQALEWSEEYAAEQTELEVEFLVASRSEAEREAREEREQRERELAAAKRIAETAQQLADSEKQRAEEQTRAAHRQGRLNRIIGLVGVVAVLLAILAFFAYLSANTAREAAVILQSEAQAASTRAIEEKLNADAAQATAVVESLIRATAEAQAVRQKEKAEAASTNVAAQRATAEGNLQRANQLVLANDAKNLLAAPEGNVEAAALLSLHVLNQGYLPQADAVLVEATSRLYAQQLYSEHTERVTGVAFSADGGYLLTGSWDKTLRLRDTATGQTLRVFTAPAPIVAVAIAPTNRWVLGATDQHALYVWDVTNEGQPPRIFTDTAEVLGVAFAPNGHQFATADGDGNARLWELNPTQDPVALVLHGHTDKVYSVAFSKEGGSLLTGSDDKTARLWNLATGQTIRLFRGHSERVTSVAFSPDEQLVLTASRDRTAGVWNLATGQRVLSLTGHADWLSAAAFSPDGRYLLTASYDLTARLWEARTGALIRVFSGHTNVIQSAAYAPDGKTVLTGARDNTARLWNADPNEHLRLYGGTGGGLTSVALSADGQWLVVGQRDKLAQVWQVATNEVVATLRDHVAKVNSVAVSSDGQWALTGSEDQTIRLWQLPSGRMTSVLTGHAGEVLAVAFSPDGRWALTGGEDQTARLWSLTDDSEPRVLRGHDNAVSSVAFSADGRWLATGSWDHTARIWDAATGEVVQRLTDHNEWVTGVAFSPDGRWLATSSWDYTARLWDTATWQSMYTLTAHTSGVLNVAFSPNSRFLLTGGADNTGRLWETATGHELRVLSGHHDWINGAVFLPESQFVITVSEDRTARLWDTDFRATMRWACEHLLRGLTEDERGRYGLRADIVICPE